MKINKRTLFENCNSFGVSGVYAITNKTTGERYIGSSKDIRGRWYDHTEPSSWEQHPNVSLYLDMQKYGIEGFAFTIVALVEEDYLKEVEQEAMEMLNHEYNNNRALVTDGERKEQQKEYCESEKGKATRKKYCESEKGKAAIKAAAKKYQAQICIYNGEELTLNALANRFRRLGIPHSTKEAKKYLVI